MIELVSWGFMIIGAACSLIGTIGLVRFPDVYTRLHANTVVVVGGAIMLIIGATLSTGLSAFLLKGVVIAVFLFLTNPVGSHAIARAAHRAGVKLWYKSVADKLKEDEG
ncbi:MAG: monovalent cation/H(+) antiporter subunit G [Candidatus Hadarchaeales archaeon]